MIVKVLLKLLAYFVLPIVIIIFLFSTNIFLGMAGLIVYLLLGFSLNRVYFYRMRAKMEYGKGNLENAIKWLEKAVSNKNCSIETKVNYGFVLLKAGKLDEAERILTHAADKSLTRDDKNQAKSNLALVIWKKGDLDKAIAMLKEVVSEYKTTAIYGSLGYLIIEKGDLDEALEINMEAYDYNPDNAVIMDNLAHLYHSLNEMDKARELFIKLMEKNPHFPEAYYDYGQFLVDEGKEEEALRMFEKALTCPFSFNSTITKEQVAERYELIKADTLKKEITEENT